MGKEKLSNIELIHWISLYPKFKGLFEGGLVKGNSFILDMFDKFTTLEKYYLQYCMDAYSSGRNYDLLRTFLEMNVNENKGSLGTVVSHVLSEGVARVMSGDYFIERVYDLGAGHSAWSKILRTILPFAHITLIDKEVITDVNHDFEHMRCNLFEWILDDRFADLCGPHTLFFISEFLHCKEHNLDVLKTPGIKESHVLINELSPSEYYIDYRLSLTGGRLIEPGEINSLLKIDSMMSYQNAFNYYLAYHIPEIER